MVDNNVGEYEELVYDDVAEQKASGVQGINTLHTTSFKDFLLKEELQRAISDCGFEHPSHVQKECIPRAILGVDVLCQAKAGMGKTAVFVLSILNQF